MAKPYNKFKAIKTIYDGFKYDSKREAEYAKKLDLLKRSFKPSEKVLGYRRQVPYPIIVNGKHICVYKLDFLVTYADGREEAVDTKGYRTDTYKLKKKLVESLYPITILEK